MCDIYSFFPPHIFMFHEIIPCEKIFNVVVKDAKYYKSEEGDNVNWNAQDEKLKRCKCDDEFM